MDYQKIYQSHLSNQFTDLELIINDGINNLSMKVHKLILNSIPYFEKSFALKNETTITLNVLNAFVAHDIIMSVYNQKTNKGDLDDWFHLLITFQIKDSWGLKNDITLLYNLIVPADGFDLFLKVGKLMGFNDKIVDTVKKNLPENYDFAKLSSELIDLMIINHHLIQIQQK